MNRQRSVAVLVVLCFLVACASGPERIAYTSINGAVDAAQASLKAWNEGFYTPGVKVDPVLWNARRDAVKAGYEKFQNSARLATTLAQDISQKENAVKVASDAAADLIALIASLEKK
jgi:hypothetical protein